MAAANIQILYDDCLKTYVDSMQKDFNTVESYLSMDSLFQLHARMQNESLSKVSVVVRKFQHLLWLYELIFCCMN